MRRGLRQRRGAARKAAHLDRARERARVEFGRRAERLQHGAGQFGDGDRIGAEIERGRLANTR